MNSDGLISPSSGAGPAQQGFDAGDAAVGQRHAWLVHHAEFAAVERPAQLRDDRCAMPGLGVHGLVVDLIGVAAFGLGLVHRGVGELEQVGRHQGVVRIQADSQRRRDVDVVALVHLQRPAERQQDFTRHAFHRLQAADVLEDHGELVAAQARHRVRSAEGRLQSGSRGLEQAVAGRMAERIVDVLEPVQVEEQHRHPGFLATRADDGPAEALGQQRPVRQAGQGVVVGQVAQFLLGALPVGDVVDHGDEVTAHAQRIAHLRHLDPAQEFLVVLAPLPHLAGPVARALEDVAHAAIEVQAVLAGIEQAGVVADHFLLAVSGDPREGRVDRDEAEFQVDHRDRLAHAAQDFQRHAGARAPRGGPG